MSDNTAVDNGNNEPAFQIQRIYLKDMSLEQPNSPEVLFEQEQSKIDIQLGVDAQPVAEGLFEVCVIATVTATVGSKTLFLVEGKQAGLFEIRNVPAEAMQQVLGITCPQIVYPYLRANIGDLVTRAGFPPIHLAEINFQAMFEARQAQALAAAEPANTAAA